MTGRRSITAKAINVGATWFGKRKKPQCDDAIRRLSLALPMRLKPLRYYVRRLILIFRAFTPPSASKYSVIQERSLDKFFGKPLDLYERSIVQKIRCSMPLMVRIAQLLAEMQRKTTIIAHGAISAVTKQTSPTISKGIVSCRQSGVGIDVGCTPDDSMHQHAGFTDVLSSRLSFKAVSSRLSFRAMSRRNSLQRADCTPEATNNGVFWPQEQCIQHVLGLVCECINLVKVCTVRVCLKDVVLPIKQELQDLTIKYDSLRKQFTSARTSYLKEVSSMRDRLGDRLDPRLTTELSGDDHRSFLFDAKDVAHRSFLFDAKECLTVDESEFLVAVLKEEIKMLFDSDAGLKSKADVSQIERLMAFSATTEVKQLRTELDTKESQIQELRQRISDGGQPMAAATGKIKGLVEYLEDDIKELRSSNREFKNATDILEIDLKESQDRYQECKAKYDELCKQHRELESENNHMKNENETMKQNFEQRISGLWNDLRQTEENYEDFKKEVHEQSQRKDSQVSKQIGELGGEIERIKTQKEEKEQELRLVMLKVKSLGIQCEYSEAELRARNVADLSQLDTPAKTVFHRVKPFDKSDVYLNATENLAKGPDEDSAIYIRELESECQRLRERLQNSSSGRTPAYRVPPGCGAPPMGGLFSSVNQPVPAPVCEGGIQVSHRSEMHDEILEQAVDCFDANISDHAIAASSAGPAVFSDHSIQALVDLFAELGIPDQKEKPLLDDGCIRLSSSCGSLSSASSIEEVQSEVERLRTMQDVLFKAAAEGDMVEDEISTQVVLLKRKLSVAECLHLTKRVQGISQTWARPHMTEKTNSKTCHCGATKELQAHRQVLMNLVAAVQKTTLAAEHGQSAASGLRSQVCTFVTAMRQSMASTSNDLPEAAQLQHVCDVLDDILKGAFSRSWIDVIEQTLQAYVVDGDRDDGKPKQAYDRVNGLLEAAEERAFPLLPKNNKDHPNKKESGVQYSCNSSVLQQRPTRWGSVRKASGKRHNSAYSTVCSTDRQALGKRHNSTNSIDCPTVPTMISGMGLMNRKGSTASMDSTATAKPKCFTAPTMISGIGLMNRQGSTASMDSAATAQTGKPKPKAKATTARRFLTGGPSVIK